jgi:dimethylsulfide dehydrogenase subunit gamma/complex iron-sulfur molybdoenzyme family reductase subunit gamma
MNTRNWTRQLVVAGLLVAAGCLANSAAVAQSAPEQQNTIRVLSAPGANASSPQAAIWKKASATQVALEPAFPGHESIVGTPVTERLTVQAVRAGDLLFLKLAWSDLTANTTIKDTAAFVDGAAVQFPINVKEDTPPFMGDPDNPVNIWHWNATGRTQNLVAHGFGSATPMPFEGLKSAAVRTDSGWAVVLTRSLGVKPDDGVILQGKGTIPVAFAVWDGENQERDGLKAVTLEWWQLQF